MLEVLHWSTPHLSAGVYTNLRAVERPLQPSRDLSSLSYQPLPLTWFLNNLSSSKYKERPKRSFMLVIKPKRKFTLFDPSGYMCWTVSLQVTYFGEAEVEETLRMLLDKELVPVTLADGGSRILFLFTLSIKQCCQTHISFSVKHFISHQPVQSLKATVCSASVLQKAALHCFA